jgi:hypothetical protein
MLTLNSRTGVTTSVRSLLGLRLLGKAQARRCSFLLSPILLGVLLCLSGPAASGQTASTGALTGKVTDQSGAVVEGAQVAVTSEATGQKQTVVSRRDGSYIVPLLAPGSYRIEISRSGFKAAVKPGLQITVTETARLNVQLAVGAVNTEVIINAVAPILQTDSAALGQVTSGEQIRELPLVTRNYTQIIALNPGVAADVNNGGELGSGNKGFGGAPIVSNGVAEADNNVQMNGVAINDLQSSGSFSGGVAIPNPDSIEEFKVQTGQYDAAYGRNAGANVDVVTKGGTDKFHGSAWEFLRNDALNANDFFRNKTGQPRAVLKQNQFGFTFGGPIKHDKLFFFTTYQGTRQRNGIDPLCSTFINSPALTNDRSAAALGALFAGQRGFFQNLFGGVGPAIAANGSNINPVALKLLQQKLPNGQFLVPTPQTIDPAQTFDAQGSSTISATCPYTENQFQTNGDWQISQKSKLEVRFFFANSTQTAEIPPSQVGGGQVPGAPSNITNNYRNFTLAHQYLISSTMSNQAILGFHRTIGFTDQQQGFSWAQLGATVPAFDSTNPIIGLGLLSSPLSIGGNGQTLQVAQNNYNFQDSLVWSKGRHTFRFGGGIAREQANYSKAAFFGGVALYLTWADFLLGLDGAGNGTGITSNVFESLDLPGQFGRAFRVWEGNAYVQDDIKLTSRLTVNLGLRYDRLGDIADDKGRNASFNFSLANPNPPAGGTLAGTVVPSNFSGGAIPAGVTQSGSAFGFNGDGQNTWNPRVGFAWQLPHTQRFVLRGGYGVYHSRFTGQPFIQLLTVPPFSILRQPSLFANAAATDQQPFSLSSPTFPAFVPYSPATSTTLTTFDPHFRPPMTQEYSLGVQAELAKNTALEVGYSGSRGLHLIRSRFVNQAQLASPADPIRGVTTNTFGNVNSRVPFQGFATSDSVTEIESAGSSWYNALLVSLNHRFSHGLHLQASYTFAKNLSTESATTTGVNGGQAVGDQNNPRQRYGPDLFVRKHRLILNYTYEFPGPKNRGEFLKESLGGWALSGVTTVQSGQHLTVGFNNFTNVFGTVNDRASLSGTCNPGQYVSPGNLNYINGSCFAVPAAFDPANPAGGAGFGNAGVGLLDGPGQHNWDIAVTKTFLFHWPKEGANLQFRAEFFNAFNHTQFGNPNLGFSIDPVTMKPVSTFGQITTTSVAPRIIQFALKLHF